MPYADFICHACCHAAIFAIRFGCCLQPLFADAAMIFRLFRDALIPYHCAAVRSSATTQQRSSSEVRAAERYAPRRCYYAVQCRKHAKARGERSARFYRGNRRALLSTLLTFRRASRQRKSTRLPAQRAARSAVRAARREWRPVHRHRLAATPCLRACIIQLLAAYYARVLCRASCARFDIDILFVYSRDFPTPR